MVIAITAFIGLIFQWRENQRRDREVAELRTLAVGLEKEVEQRRNSILYLLDHLDLSQQKLWGRMRWSDDVLRKRRLLIHDQQALAGLALQALAIAGKQEKNRERDPMALNLARTHPGVAIHFRVGMKTGLLFFASPLHAFADRDGRFFARGGRFP
jgi:hypothetical protein